MDSAFGKQEQSLLVKSFTIIQAVIDGTKFELGALRQESKQQKIWADFDLLLLKVLPSNLPLMNNGWIRWDPKRRQNLIYNYWIILASFPDEICEEGRRPSVDSGLWLDLRIPNFLKGISRFRQIIKRLTQNLLPLKYGRNVFGKPKAQHWSTLKWDAGLEILDIFHVSKRSLSF